MVCSVVVIFVKMCEFKSDCIFTAIDCLVMEYIGELKLFAKNSATAGFFSFFHNSIKSSLFQSINLCKSLSELFSLRSSTHMQGTKRDFMFNVSEELLLTISSNTKANSWL